MVSVTITTSGISIDDLGPDRAETLIKDVLLSIADGAERLSPEERLAVVEILNGRAVVGDRRYAALLHDAGCFDHAANLFMSIGYWRKVGDYRLALGDIAGAIDCYSRPKNKNKDYAFRAQPDYDRLLGIAFRSNDWMAVIDRIRQGRPSTCSFDERQVFFANATKPKAPLLKFLLLAAVRADRVVEVEREFADAFGCSASEWKALIVAASISDDKLAKEQTKSFPPALKKERLTIEEAVAKGSTERVAGIVSWLNDSKVEFARCEASLSRFLQTGDEPLLRIVVGWLLTPDCYTILRTAFFSLMNGTMLHTSTSRHALSVYRFHPSIARAGMQEYLQALVRAGDRLSGQDLYICVLQHLTFDYSADPLARGDAQALLKSRMQRAADWAEAKLTTWFSESTAQEQFNVLRRIVSGNSWQDVRKTPEWSQFMKSAVAYLEAAWSEEIGATWQSEEVTFHAFRNALPGVLVEQHARPIWLAPQHLDIFIPSLKIAVEYMGLQHYEPVDYFGGATALQVNQERDARKAHLCRVAGIRLEYVRYDENILERVHCILNSH